MSVPLLNSHQDIIAVVMGDLTLSTLDSVLPVFIDISQDAKQDVTLDLSSVAVIDAAAIGLIIALNQRLVSSGRALTLLCPPGQPRGLLSLVGLDSQVKMIETYAPGPAVH